MKHSGYSQSCVLTGFLGKESGGGRQAHLVEDPDLAIHCRPGHPVAIIVEEDPLFLGIPAQRCAKLLDFIHSGVEALLVSSL